jgi:hypothetical protein
LGRITRLNEQKNFFGWTVPKLFGDGRKFFVMDGQNFLEMDEKFFVMDGQNFFGDARLVLLGSSTGRLRFRLTVSRPESAWVR